MTIAAVHFRHGREMEYVIGNSTIKQTQPPYRQYICVMIKVVEKERIWDQFKFRFRHACRFAGIFYRPDTHITISAVWIRTYKTSKQPEILRLLFQSIIVKEQKVFILKATCISQRKFFKRNKFINVIIHSIFTWEQLSNRLNVE